MNSIAQKYKNKGLVSFSFKLVEELNQKNNKSKKVMYEQSAWKNINLDNYTDHIKNHHNGIAIITGKISGVTVFDIDNKNEKDSNNGFIWWNKMIEKYGEIKTWRVKTGNNGYHYYFKYNSDIKTTANCILDNNKYTIDIRNDDGIIFAPPTKYKSLSGLIKDYQWIQSPDNCELSDIPDWLLNLCKEEKNNKKVIKTKIYKNIEVKNNLFCDFSDNQRDFIAKEISALLVLRNHETISFDKFEGPSLYFKTGKLRICPFNNTHSNNNFYINLLYQNNNTYNIYYKCLSKSCNDFKQLYIGKFIFKGKKIEFSFTPDDDNTAAEIAYFHVKDRIKKCGDSIFFYNEKNGLWEEETNNKDKLFKYIVNIPFLGAYSKMCNKVNNMKKFLYSKFDDDWEFIKNADYSNLGKLHFSNCIYDIENDAILDFNPEIISFHNINRPFPKIRNESVIAEVKKALFDDIFNDDNVKHEYQKALGVTMTGKNVDRRIWLYIGEPSAGKSVAADAIAQCLGPYVHTIKGTALVHSKYASANSADTHFIDMRRKRFLFTTEMTMHEKLDGPTMKRISGGDIITARENYAKTQQEIMLQGTLNIFVNDMPAIEPMDDAMRDRIRVFPFVNQFLLPDKINKNNKYHKLKDPDIKSSKIKTLEWKDALFHILCDGYKMWKNDKGFIDNDVIKNETTEWCDSMDNFKKLFNELYEVTNDENDYVLTSSVHDKFKNLSLSSKMLSVKILKLIKLKKNKGSIIHNNRTNRVFYGIREKDDDDVY